MASVLNMRMVRRVPEGAVFVGRPSPWGNPIYLSSEDQREWVITQFERYARRRLEREPDWLEPLRGRDLLCFCAPARCHADTLLALVKEMYGDE